VEQVLCELEETLEHKMDKTQAQIEDAVKSKEKVILLVSYNIQ